MLELNTINLNLLHTFHVFSQCQTVHATALRLGRSQPAISARLHMLEHDIDAQLLERCGRGLALTPLGRIFSARLDELFAGVQELLDQARASTAKPTGVLRIGALPTVGVFLLAPKVADFRRRYPSVEVELIHGPVNEQLTKLQGGDLDLVVGVGDLPGGFDVAQIGDVQPVVVMQMNSRRFSNCRISPSQLQELEWVAFGETGDSFFDAAWRFLEQHGLDSRVRVKVPHIQTLKSLVIAGAGASILPSYTVVEPELEAHRIEGLDFTQPIWIATRSSSLSIPLVASFREEVIALNLHAD